MDNVIKIPKGITAILGSGGKTTLAHFLAETLDGTVIFTTTTRIFPSESLKVYVGNDEKELINLLKIHKKICLGQRADKGKLQQSPIPMSRLAQLADYVLVEADGSKGLPIKAHRDFEPVIPPDTGLRILVVGASGFGQPIQAACHCPQLFADLANCPVTQAVTAKNLATIIAKENLADIVMVNQCNRQYDEDFARELATYLQLPLVYGALQDGALTVLNQ